MENESIENLSQLILSIAKSNEICAAICKTSLEDLRSTLENDISNDPSNYQNNQQNIPPQLHHLQQPQYVVNEHFQQNIHPQTQPIVFSKQMPQPFLMSSTSNIPFLYHHQ